MKISQAQGVLMAALADADWIEAGAYSVLADGDASDTGESGFIARLNAALAAKGVAFVALAPSGMPMAVAMHGGRGSGLMTLGVAVCAVGGMVERLAELTEKTIEVGVAAFGDELTGVDFGRVSEMGGGQAMVISFDIQVSV